MILAHPDSDLRKNLMVVGADIVSILDAKNHKDKFILVEDVMEEFLKADNQRTPDMFLNSLSFLFAMGIIERTDYRVKLLKLNKQTKLQNQLEFF